MDGFCLFNPVRIIILSNIHSIKTGIEIGMHPILIEFGPVTLYTYGLLVALGVLIGSLWAAKRAQSKHQDADTYLMVIFWMIILGFVGARLLYFVYFPEFYLNNPIKLLTDRGGLVWYGGLITAVVTALAYLKIKKIPIGMFADITIIPAALGLAIGRIGCFMAGCCYGKPTTSFLGVQFPHSHETFPAFVHPTQLYESASLIVLILLLQQMFNRSKTPGVTASLFFIGYGVIRFIIEYFRGDGVYWVGHLLTASQVISLCGILIGLMILWRIKREPTLHPKAVSAP